MTRAYGIAVLVVLTAINFLNYIDRYVLAAVLESVRIDFALDDADSGLLGLMFIIVYSIVSPFTGWLGDRSVRKYLVVAGVGLWSLATVGCGYVGSYEQLLVMRALVGIGEAGYATVAPAMIADVYEPKRRGRMLAYFYLAIPVGSALGYVLGGWIADNWESVVSSSMLSMLGLADVADPGWRLAFVFAGVPGIAFALAALLLREPVRGGRDEARAEERHDSPLRAIERLFRSPAFRSTTGGMILMTFTLGGLAFWMPTFLQRAMGMEEGSAGTVFGAITVVAGISATLVGGWMGDRAFERAQGGYLRVSGWGLIAGTPFVLVLAWMGNLYVVLALAFAAEFLLFLNTGPLNAALVGCVPANLRASSIAINVLFIHLLGDALSPWLMGLISDHLGGLRLALFIAGIPPVLGGIWLLRGAAVLDRHPQGLAARD